MVTYKIHTGINGNSVDRIYVSTPKGVFNLKNKALGGVIELSENALIESSILPIVLISGELLAILILLIVSSIAL